jgi:hypothetical protein
VRRANTAKTVPNNNQSTEVAKNKTAGPRMDESIWLNCTRTGSFSNPLGLIAVKNDASGLMI